MAVLSTRGLSGQIGKQLVFKVTKGKTIVSAYVEPRKRKGTELQNLFRDCFRRAQKRASHDSRKKEFKGLCASYLKEGQSVYHFLMGLYHREEIRMMKKAEKEYNSIEVLLRGEPKKGKEVAKLKTSKVTTDITNVFSFPIVKKMESQVIAIPSIDSWITKPFYRGWVSSMG